jgi:CheY-like chemotaxis protein
VVGMAEDELTALAWLRKNAESCDLLLIDIQLKRGSGLGVLRVASRLPRPLALVVLTNYATPQIREHCLRLGANRVFDKSNEFGPFLDYCARLAPFA